MSNYTIIKNSNHADWLRAREGGIGSSEVGTILGLNPFCTPYKLWRLKTGRDAFQEDTENVAMKMGHYLEPVVAQLYADTTGSTLIKSTANEFVVVSKKHDFMRVSPDRLMWSAGVSHSEKNKRIVECKTSRMAVDADNPHEQWVAQLIYQMGVYEKDYGALAWLVQGLDFGYRNIDFDKDLFDFITEEVTRFWVDNILGDQEPPALNASDVLIKYPRHKEGKTVEADDTLYEDYLELKGTKAEISRLQKTKDELEERIKVAMGDAELLRYNDSTLASWKASKDKIEFNSELFKKDNPALFDKYSASVAGTRRFMLK